MDEITTSSPAFAKPHVASQATANLKLFPLENVDNLVKNSLLNILMIVNFSLLLLQISNSANHKNLAK